MTTSFTSTTVDRLDEVVRFLLEVFQLETTPEVWRSDVLKWKLFDPHPLWAGSRSYVLESDGVIAAHVTAAPLRFRVGASEVQSMQFIDWAAAQRVPGGGIFLCRKCLSICDTVLAVGGLPDARRIISQLPWFTRVADVRSYAYFVRPFHRLLTSPPTVVHELLKAGRDAVRSLYPPLPSDEGWACEWIDSFSRVWTPRGPYVPIQRSVDWLNYLRRCPAMPFRAMSLTHHGVPAGHALVALTPRSARLIDLVVDADEVGQWVAALASLTRKVSQEPGIVELTTRSSLAAFAPVFERCGFRSLGVVPVYLADPKDKLPRDIPLEVNLLVGDAGYF